MLKDLSAKLSPFGFHVLGATNLLASERVTSSSPSAKSVVLVGNVGSGFWPKFSQSVEFLDGEEHPLDRYSKHILDEVADVLPEATAVYPSDGPPYWPFQTWALRSGQYHQSPVAVLIHQKFGLWTAFRGAILLPHELEAVATSDVSPCESCVTKPCLNACPVGAFTPPKGQGAFGSYLADSCRTHVGQRIHDEGGCYNVGCKARLACPVNSQLSYDAEQFRFHMNKFAFGTR